jgi:protein-L-isoaspartate(D-aspartate) O-methyltransferase
MLRAAIVALGAGILAAAAAGEHGRGPERESERRRMVEDIERQSLSIGRDFAQLDARVLDAMRKVPRHAFVPASASALAYADRPLDIGYRQTISQPLVVALMTHLLQVRRGDRVLEIGTGSGYQAAVLSLLASEVCSVEILPELAARAGETLARLGYANVKVRAGDGYHGWAEHAPYDRIIVTAAPDHMPPALLTQLKPYGRLVIPVGASIDAVAPGVEPQELMLIEKAGDGTATSSRIIPVRFVPLTRDQPRK